MKHQFTLEFWQDEKFYVGRLREVPGVFSQGADLAELESNIEDAYRLVVADSLDFPAEHVQSKPLLLDVA